MSYNNKNIVSNLTSESVSCGHPDKICDQISDLILDEYLRNDPDSKVAAECMVTPNNVILAGEVKSNYSLKGYHLDSMVRNLIKSIGYDSNGFDYANLKITNYIHKQSSEINNAVISVNGEGAGDQGIMFGYASNENEALMPSPLYYSHKLMKLVAEYDRSRFGPDAKCQVTLDYNAEQMPVRVNSVVLSTQHKDGINISDIKDEFLPVIKSVFPEDWIDDVVAYFINPSGSFVIGGPQSDVGLTGRKIIVDTYGGAAPHGGGAFSGKDPSKVDRSAAYMARYLAKNIVASKVAKKCLIQISYAIGVSEPVSILLDTFGTSKVPHDDLIKTIRNSFDLTPKGIKTLLRLNSPIYLPTATYGHFGRTPTDEGLFSWEKVDSTHVFESL